MAKDYDLRPYGPGKFNTFLDAAVYQLSLEGVDEEVGDVGETGFWCGVMRNGQALAVHAQEATRYIEEHDVRLTEDEFEYLRAAKGGVIVCEDDRGFVTVNYYKTEYELDQAWAQIEREAEKYMNPAPDTKKLKSKLLR